MAECKLVNVFGGVATEQTQEENVELMRELLVQIKILNIHMQTLSDQKVLVEDVYEGEYDR